MMLESLREEVCRANFQLVAQGLVSLNWGNVSAICGDRRHVVIKPSGVPYDRLCAEQMVVVDIEGNLLEGDLRPSSDLAVHLYLYREFDCVGGVTHTHSLHATMFAQARKPIPCLGTTHADHFHGEVPLTRALTSEEVEDDYEHNTGKVIVERFRDIDPRTTPAVLLPGRSPFAWGKDAADSVRNAAALESIARIAIGTWQLDPAASPLEPYVLEKHYQRKHGPDAYYGQR
jgi:L-ribulose-5-phosphate 4-epimerase